MQPLLCAIQCAIRVVDASSGSSPTFPHLAKLLLQLPLHFCDVGTPILRHRNKVECVPKGVNLIR